MTETSRRHRLGRILKGRWAAVGLLIVAVLISIGWRYRVTRADYRLASGQQAVRDGEWKSAESLSNKLEAAGHKDHANLLRAQLHFARKRPDLALAECNKFRTESAFRLEATILAAKCLLELGSLIEANRVFGLVLREQPDNVDAHRGAAAIAYELGQLARAVFHLENVIRLDPDDARPHRLLGEIHRDSGDNQSAVQEFQESLRLKKNLSADAINEVRFELAYGLLRLYRFGEAMDIVDAAAAEDGEQPLYMKTVRAESLRGLGRLDEAAALVDQLLVDNQENALYLLRGQLYMDLGDAKEALPWAEKSAALAPRNYQAQLVLVQVYAALGRTAEAERVQARANKIFEDLKLATDLGRQATERPWDPEVRLRLAEYCARTGDAKGAEMWRKAATHCRTANQGMVTSPDR